MASSAPRLLSFPLLDGVAPDGRLAWADGDKSIREVMLNILLTRPGERLLRPDFGAGLRDFIHHPNNETTRALVADAVQRALVRWEPRVSIEEVRVVPDPQRLSHINLSIRYRLRQDGRRDSLDLAIELGA
ncbi:MAG TPA: GPW/gp25 family protein [Zoogloea sp.]|uniref:GPW/gp25 family protein n=1 Tax=Zoogloea sp. TaxID=49181 RepID=UPI002B6F8D19|nr:GPW/gp25 family protein [Zoogloea sp.]HMV17245.1 GPW/gp25 family protein [Rhodocyclaceae bacterium]HMV62585.1 GPW/gp25 family protein [Rhodocyclaceae bacterium]HMW51070.1 GPW/gp25 family protein [Rhodocyclaceae bacterium]HMY49527.1 GPW/gp25 family protein [Rhodocyclaceae bacterium]HMZ75712.1 GPW/gp25 family protein [Rhodocyclaceae bacterium]